MKRAHSCAPRARCLQALSRLFPLLPSNVPAAPAAQNAPCTCCRVQVPIIDIQKALRSPQNNYYAGRRAGALGLGGGVAGAAREGAVLSQPGEAELLWAEGGSRHGGRKLRPRQAGPNASTGGVP